MSDLWSQLATLRRTCVKLERRMRVETTSLSLARFDWLVSLISLYSVVATPLLIAFPGFRYDCLLYTSPSPRDS